MGEPMLQVDGVHLNFGGLAVLDDLAFSVEPGHVSALIGPNGAGKTSLFNCVSRLYEPTSGSIRVHGREILTVKPHQAVTYGVARTFQNVGLFQTLSALDNVLVGSHTRIRSGMLSALTGAPWGRRAERNARTEALALLRKTQLSDVAERPVAELPFGTQKRLELVRALMARPRLLLLDEPANGLDHSEVGELAEFIRGIVADHELTVLLVEHHIGMVVEISDRVVVMNLGRKIAEGAAAEVTQDPAVVQAYLGSPV